MKNSQSKGPVGPVFYGVFGEGRTGSAALAIAWFTTKAKAEEAQVPHTVVLPAEQLFGSMFFFEGGR